MESYNTIFSYNLKLQLILVHGPFIQKNISSLNLADQD
jgi:hypothetical protein